MESCIQCGTKGWNYFTFKGEKRKQCRICRRTILTKRTIDEKRRVMKVAHKKWLLLHPEQAKESKYNRHLKKKYGITIEEYNNLVKMQGGVCALCGNPPSDKGASNKRLNVDHNHNTGIVRGLLCWNCNSILGKLHDDAELATRIAEYLNKSYS